MKTLRELADAAMPAPWAHETPYDERSPVDHEGCAVWPWESEESMEFAYTSRSGVPLLLDVLDAAKTLTKFPHSNRMGEQYRQRSAAWSALKEAIDRYEGWQEAVG